MPFDATVQYILNESRARDNLGCAFGTRASKFWHISLVLVDFVFDNIIHPYMNLDLLSSI